MAAILATALPIGPLNGPVFKVSPCPQPRRMVCRWIVDPATGRLAAVWETDSEPEKPVLHLWVVRS